MGLGKIFRRGGKYRKLGHDDFDEMEACWQEVVFQFFGVDIHPGVTSFLTRAGDMKDTKKFTQKFPPYIVLPRQLFLILSSRSS
jgi:hypothetical protein